MTNIEDLRAAAIQAIVAENNLASKPFLGLHGVGRSKDTRSLAAIPELSQLNLSPETATHVINLLVRYKAGHPLSNVQKVVLALNNREPGF
ncbi:hypothetical protein A3H89_03465 [Candidatus Amesbacteria bacterium RIFCSPLOWO2_02_FULL_48_11]|uniref:Uncharacterized protein n=3 Tax=Candidatus Amesiibacteriota TaxID=1752730 RepID=A0A1F4Z5S0_9BACT|nr:MAG: hypothetical protein UY22_C0018G0017 [Candidatus Amesbacteria bacterium GW2011_GWC1_48_10]OGC89146.1 MAG: hypothetical protein A2V48_00705 [Candidatus Amesbacteria bacterium RBG_19FT_COMBO_48_16]OGC96627.1 MAG: hypothetical protein A3C34_00795 [Candidatus Amesbacteria bacterium RIFCSPHIGHO2_02_FULL_48_21]OGC98129.1 MAG: hypothetical protein A2W16_00330 [Candidatus Amesbacteria bacterium RBG_16_48_31]OGD00189.1 MAG: hypothetical protein A2702_01885 [Candidatus Amesbacteria bacterium RIFC